MSLNHPNHHPNHPNPTRQPTPNPTKKQNVKVLLKRGKTYKNVFFSFIFVV